MKFNVLIVFCIICFVQVYSDDSAASDDDRRVDLEPIIRENIVGVSDRFVRDFLLIIDKYAETEFIATPFSEDFLERLVKKIQKNEKTSKIDLDGIRKFQSHVVEFSIKNETPFEEIIVIDYLKVVQSILSKNFSPDQYIGITNLFYVIVYSKATTEEVEGALDYLYGTGNTELKDFVTDLPTPSATDCPQTYKRYSTVNDQLKSITGIKPEVLANITAIVEKFPCNDKFGIPFFLQSFLKIVERLKHLVSINNSKISACFIKKETETADGLNSSLLPDGKSIKKEEEKLNNFEFILSTRFADEDFRGLINFVKATVFDKTPLNEVQKSLEYVFTDVAAVDC